MDQEPVRRRWYWRNEHGKALTGEIMLTDEEALTRREAGQNIWPSEGWLQLHDKLRAEVAEMEKENEKETE